MILPERKPVPEMNPDLPIQEAENLVFEIAYANGFNDALAQVEAANMKPDGHYWDHTSKTYRDMLTSKEPEAPRAS